MHETSIGDWLTARGNPIGIEWRRGTMDRRVVDSTIVKDAYRTGALFLRGWAFDIGSYIGTVAIALALDNPELRALALEPVPENLELCRRNVGRNGLSDRVQVLDGAIAQPGRSSVTVRYLGEDGGPGAEHNFVGNSSSVSFRDRPHSRREVVGYSVQALIEMVGEIPCFMKIDCEGGEWGAFADPASALVPRIHGEYHLIDGHLATEIDVRLGETHDIVLDGPDRGIGLFRAIRRVGRE
jgi:FkbM family methyltransferase